MIHEAPTDLALVLVHYHTPRLAEAAVERLRAVARAEELRLALTLVDNGSDHEGRERLRALAQRTDARLLEPGRNLGYAAGANLGLEGAEAGRLGVMNPDVLVAPGCLRSLIEALDAGAGVVGPRHYWDEAMRLSLPPGERRGRLPDLVAALGRRHPRWSALARSRWRRHARRHWTATRPIAGEPSGAMLVFSRVALLATGPFDEGYRLYFEETDWLARARDARVRVEYVPSARAVHLYGQSSSLESAAPEWLAISAERFRRIRYGSLWSAVLRLVERGPALARTLPVWPAAGASIEAGEYWYEVSPEPAGYPAAAEVWTGKPAEWQAPEGLRRKPEAPELAVRVVDWAGRELGCFGWPGTRRSPDDPRGSPARHIAA